MKSKPISSLLRELINTPEFNNERHDGPKVELIHRKNTKQANRTVFVRGFAEFIRSARQNPLQGFDKDDLDVITIITHILYEDREQGEVVDSNIVRKALNI